MKTQTHRTLFAAGLVGMFVTGTQLPVPIETEAPVPPAKVTFEGMEPCEHEDGPGPCAWDAGESGNGRGLSFWIDCNQRTHYLDPATQIRMEAKGINRTGSEAYDSTC